MSRREQDWEYIPKATTVKPSKSFRRTRQVQPVDYSEAELDLETESEITLSNSSRIEEDSPVKRETQLDREDSWELSDLGTPGTLTSQAQKVGDQLTRITERTRQREMAQQSEMAGMEKILEMMMKMRQEDKREQRETEQKNERERLKREERKESEGREREERCDERQLQLLTQLKEAQPAVPQQVTIQNHKLPQMNERGRGRHICTADGGSNGSIRYTQG